MWNFVLPTDVLFGEGAIDQLPQRVNTLGRRCLLVCDKAVAQTPVGRHILASIDAVGLFQEVEPNPTVVNVNAMVHACSFPLSSRFHLPHGAACAFTLEAALRLNAPAMDGRMEAFAAYCGFTSVEAMADAVRELKRIGGLPCTLADAGIPVDAVEDLVKDSFHPLMKNNPVDITADDLRGIYLSLEG